MDAAVMGVGNALVSAVLRSRLHGLVSGAVGLVRYEGRLSGRVISTPTQYAEHGDEVIILVGRPESKTWWRNFRSDHDVDFLMRGRWLAMKARAVVGAREPDVIGPLLDVYLARFPRAARSLGADAEIGRGQAVVVVCRRR
jgi:hypothetical protein